MLKKLRLRLSLLCALSTAAILCLSSFLTLDLFERRLMQNVQAAFEGNLSALCYRLQAERSLSWDWLARMEQDHRLLIAVYDNGARLRFPGAYQTATGRAKLLELLIERAPPDSIAPDGLRARSRRYRLTGEKGEPYLAAAAAVPVNADGSQVHSRTLYLVQDLAEVDLGGLRRQFLCVTLLASFALAALSWWLSGSAVAPVARSMRRQSEFVAAASHELRSPLGVLRANAAAVLEDAGPVGRPFAEALDRECARLGRLVEDLLTLANADAGRMSFHPGPVEPAALLEEAAAAYRAPAAEKGVLLVVEPVPPLPLLAADPERLRQMLGILLDNALQFTPAGGRVALSAFLQGRRVALRVADNGPGLPPREYGKVFRRFYRADRARSGKEHYGLGLPIAADIARLHGGALILSQTPGGGLRVTYTQPAARRR